jgi:hypothetical protein
LGRCEGWDLWRFGRRFRTNAPGVANAVLKLDLPGLHKRRVALLGDLDRGVTEQQGDLVDGNAGKQHLNRECIPEHVRVAFAQSYRGVVALMAAAHTNPESALYASCAAVHSASARLLRRAQAQGKARTDINGDDLFALMAALGWAVDQPSFAPRAEHLSRIIANAIF